MPEGSLVENILTLQGSLSAVTDLTGEPPVNGGSGSGLAGAAGLASTSLSDRVGDIEGALTLQVSDLLHFDPTTALTGVTELFGALETQVQVPPTQALEGFAQRITQANGAFMGDFVQRLQQALDAIRGISEGVPENRTAIVSALLDQILGVLASLEGPEAEKIQSWIQSLQELHRVLMPLIEAAQSAPDPSAIGVELVLRSLDSTLDVFGFNQVKSLLGFLDDFLGNALSQEALDGLSATLASASLAYAQALGLVDGSYPEFRDTVVAAAEAMQDLRAQLRPVMSVIRRIATARILQPNALESFLREQLEMALSVQVQEVQKIDDPFQEVFDRIDEAIEDIDLEFVRTDVLGFFEQVRTTIENVDIASVGDKLQDQLDTVESAVQDLQQGVTDLLAQIRDFFDELQQQYRALAGNVGTFQPDGTFQYSFEQSLRDVLSSARLAIGGDPDDPSAPSVAGSLSQFQTSIDWFLNQLSGLLQPVDEAIDDAVNTAVGGVDDFSAFLEDLDLPTLLEGLRQKVAEVLDALVPIDFALVIDPVVAEIEENTEKLRSIDTASLNDLLREALKIALDVIITIDFTASISTPLRDEFATVKAVPQEALDQLQERYEWATAMLDQLKPEKLLEALFSAFDIIEQAVGALDVATLLQPLDQWHQQYLQQPLAQLKPSTLLQPASDSFQGFTAVFDDISGAAIIEPVNAQLNALKDDVANFDITGWVDDLLAIVERVKQDLRDIRPSELFEPLVADFERLEGELDRFKPSIVFQPAAELAAPLLQFLESVQQEIIDTLFEMFQAPLQILDRLQPEALVQNVQHQIDAVIDALDAVSLPACYNQLKGQYFDLRQAAAAQGDEWRAELAALIDPEQQMGELVSAYNDLRAALEGLKQNVQLPDLADQYAELRERLLALLPPYARELMDPEKFKRVMRLADPTRFLEELDERFEALKNKLIPIRPEDITAELDTTYEQVLALVDDLDVEDSLNQVKDIINSIKDIVDSVRVDFVAADIDNAVNDFRAMVDALDPARLFADLDAVHYEVEQVVGSTLPSEVLSGLQGPLDQAQEIIGSIDLRNRLGPPLNNAWVSVQGTLDEIDFTIVLSPLVEKLDELESEFETGLRRTETAFDHMLGAAQAALSGAGVSAGVPA